MSARRLDPAAAEFLKRFGAALAFPADGVVTAAERAAYLGRERARLADSPGGVLLDPAARAVVATDHDLGSGLSARSYEPPTGTGLPVLVYLHGGGFVTGSVALSDAGCRILAADGGLVVLSVDYRLAPEHPYPAAFDDARRAVEWARSAAPEVLGTDATRIGIAGSSAGGALAAAVALHARDSGGPPLSVHALVYPVLDATMTSPSYAPEVNGRDYFVSAAQMAWYWEQYRGVGRDDDPYFSPASARDLGGLAPAIVITAEFDLLRDEGFEYHRRLVAAGVPSDHVHYPGQIHGFMSLVEAIPESLVAIRDLAVRLRAVLEGAH